MRELAIEAEGSSRGVSCHLGQIRWPSAALEYADRGVRINAVCPGTIETPMVTEMVAKGELDLAEAARDAPIGRLGQGEASCGRQHSQEPHPIRVMAVTTRPVERSGLSRKRSSATKID